MKNKSFNDSFSNFYLNLFYRWENVRLDLYIFKYLFINKIFVYQQNIFLSTKYFFINKIFEMKNISLNDIFFF